MVLKQEKYDEENAAIIADWRSFVKSAIETNYALYAALSKAGKHGEAKSYSSRCAELHTLLMNAAPDDNDATAVFAAGFQSWR
jgi:predicted negative regulator of RcsB-dependent stress response